MATTTKSQNESVPTSIVRLLTVGGLILILVVLMVFGRYTSYAFWNEVLIDRNPSFTFWAMVADWVLPNGSLAVGVYLWRNRKGRAKLWSIPFWFVAVIFGVVDYMSTQVGFMQIVNMTRIKAISPLMAFVVEWVVPAVPVLSEEFIGVVFIVFFASVFVLLVEQLELRGLKLKWMKGKSYA